MLKFFGTCVAVLICLCCCCCSYCIYSMTQKGKVKPGIVPPSKFDTIDASDSKNGIVDPTVNEHELESYIEEKSDFDN